jgi:dolichyl-phosphate beta-glucosyltransferase
VTPGPAIGFGTTRLARDRFVAVGVLATVIDVGLAVGLSSSVGRLLADLLALAVAAVIARYLHARVTLRGDDLDRWIRKPTVFFAAAFVAGAIDLAMFVGLDSLGDWTAKLLAVGTAAVARAVFHRVVLFRQVRRDQGNPIDRPAPAGSVRLSLVIPAYKEERRISETIAQVRTGLAIYHDVGDLEIVVVDDGSKDATAQVARESGADQVIVQPKNRGKGAAVRLGAAAANGRTIAFIDADLAYSPDQLVAFVNAVESGYDVVIGNRHHDDTETLRKTSALRSFGSRVVNMAANLLLLGNYRDTQCGCKAFRADVAKIVLGAGRVDGFAFDLEILHLTERYGFTMRELPVEVVNSDTSTVRAVRDGLMVLGDIIRVRWAGGRGYYPSLPADALPVGRSRPTGVVDGLPPGGK